ncbi:Cytochrome P450 2J2 [Bulinus truncatus]|nr:Cytochrome P450 2J2 [Bulinus truncatus]
MTDGRVVSRMAEWCRGLPSGVEGTKRSGTPGIFYGLILNSGQVWKELRKITSTTLRDFGVGEKSLEEKILEEVHVVLASIENQNGRPFNIKPLLTNATSNVICDVLFGSRFSYDDPKFMEFHCTLADIVKENPVNVPANFFPWMRHLPHVQKQIQKFLNVFKSADKFIGDQIAEHEATFDPSNLRDFIDLILDVRMKNTDSIHFTDNNLRNVIVDLFLAGSDTTASTLYWAMLLMADNPDIQKTCQKEIDLVLGVNKEVLLTDRASLKYTEATMMEILRFRTVAQVSFPHCTSCDTELAGYFIPGNTIIMANICALHSDAKYWENPELFTPQHFLDANENITNKDKLMAFSAGPRSCVGETLTKMELWLFITSILQSYTVKPVEGQTVDLTAHQGVTFQGLPQNLTFIHH